jgi:hypothetical protein
MLHHAVRREFVALRRPAASTGPMKLSIFAALILLFGPVRAQLPAAPQTRQFDFWLGEWNVTTPDGGTAGTSHVEQVSGGRGLLETWTGAKGGSGKSLNAWNQAKHCWQQYWIGNTGMVLELSGGLDGDGRMVLQGTRKNAEGKAIVDRITWTPEPDGTVRQQWDTSTDSGQTWKTIFEGRYRRRG